MKKAIVIFLMVLLTTKLFAQETRMVTVSPTTRQEIKFKVGCAIKTQKSIDMIAEFVFDSDNEQILMTLSYNKGASDKYSGIWFPNENIDCSGLTNFFSNNDRRLVVSNTMTNQIKNGCLVEDEFRQAISYRNATFKGPVFSKRFGHKRNDIDNRIFALEDDSELTMTFNITNNADTVIVSLNNLIPLTLGQGSSQFEKKYQLQYVANDIEFVVLIDRDGCASYLNEFDYLDKMIAFYNKHKAHLLKRATNCSDKAAFERQKDKVLSGFNNRIVESLRSTQCERIKTRLDSLDNIIGEIRNINCTDCSQYVKELRSNYNVLEKHYQVLLDYYNREPRTLDIINEFNKYKNSDALPYINNLNLTKYEDIYCQEVARELKKVKDKIKQIKKLVINRCGLTQKQADALTNEIKEACKVINTKSNEWGITDDLEAKKLLEAEIRVTITKINDKLDALHADCKTIFPDLKYAIDEFNKVLKYCKDSRIIY